MTSALTEDYLRWLGPQIRDEHDGMSHPNRTFWDLISLMFDAQFYEIVPNDQNRLEDGRALRIEFCRAADIPTNSMHYLGPNGSFLEVLIALSRRVAWTAGGRNAPGWAWVLLNNLELHRMTDPLSRTKERRAARIIDQCIRRTYSPDGTGGFFPLTHPEEDQTKVEIWYQMAAYVAELPRGR